MRPSSRTLIFIDLIHKANIIFRKPLLKRLQKLCSSNIWHNGKDGAVSFIPEKTKHSTKDNIQKIEVFITEDLDRIINKWGRTEKAGIFIFDILDPKNLSDLQSYRNINRAVKTINKYMKRKSANWGITDMRKGFDTVRYYSATDEFKCIPFPTLHLNTICSSLIPNHYTLILPER